jgi:lysophospholipid acyltransferase (LPLAT)-like uncharacterized protein
VRSNRDSRGYRWLVAFVGVLGAALLRLLGATWRVRREGPDPFQSGEPFVGAIWHGGMLIASSVWRDRGLAVVVSRSRDGDLISAVLRRLGFAEGPRGSSTRGSTEALRGGVRSLEQGTVVAMLVDGPIGPREAFKPGAIAMAAAAGVPLVPAGLAAHPALRFRSWDRTILPLPFARVVCRYGPAQRLPKSPEGDELERLRERAELALHELTRDCDRQLGRPAGAPGSKNPSASTPTRRRDHP